MQGAKGERSSWASLLVLLALGTWAALAWRYDWLCDDALISFRYARNLAEGAGLVYNPGDRVEGYTNLLWVLWLTPFEWLGADLPSVARVSTLTCALGILASVYSVVRRRIGALAAAVALLFCASLPPLGLWSTSGLETLPFTWAWFACWAALTGETPRARTAVVAGACAVLLRADGFAFVAVVLVGIVIGARLEGRRELVRPTLRVAGALALVVAAHFLWRRGYYGEWLPNTARAKVLLGAQTFERGALYLASAALTFPSLILALVVALGAARSAQRTLVVSAGLASASVLGYCMVVGGDWMPMGRFLVPAVPFLALLFAAALASRPRTAVTCALVGAALSLPSAFDRTLVPRAAILSLNYRWNLGEARTEHEAWQVLVADTRRWTTLGRALAAHTQPGESLISGTIGAVGYYSRLVIHDPFGLVSREAFDPEKDDRRRTPGHQRRIPLETFFAKSPTYVDAELVPRGAPTEGVRKVFLPGGEHAALARPEWRELGDELGAPPDTLLCLVRFVPR